MGEWSKKIGEHGEKIAEIFFNKIGWTPLASNITVECVNSCHKNDKGHPKETHGVDAYFSYLNPLFDGQCVNIVISVKYKADEKYPKSATNLVKNYLRDLCETTTCFDQSETKQATLNTIMRKTDCDYGILFWLNGADENDSLVQNLYGFKPDFEGDHTVMIVDNKQFSFIVDVLEYMQVKAVDYDCLFFYPQTGLYMDSNKRRDTGTILPVEYLTSPLQFVKLTNKNNSAEQILFIASRDGFDKDNLNRLVGLSKDLTSSWSSKVIIGFPDYETLTSKTDVDLRLISFDDSEYCKRIEVVNYKNLLNL